MWTELGSNPGISHRALLPGSVADLRVPSEVLLSWHSALSEVQTTLKPRSLLPLFQTAGSFENRRGGQDQLSREASGEGRVGVPAHTPHVGGLGAPH